MYVLPIGSSTRLQHTRAIFARAADVGIATIRRIEAQPGQFMGYVSTVLRIQPAFEKAGIKFTEEDETSGIGVRIDRPSAFSP